MANIYVDSNATGSATGADWTNAYLTLAAAAAADNAGDIIWVASDHSESTAAAVSFNWAGTAASPTRIISADKTSGTPPSTVQTGASVVTTGNSNITVVSGGYVYCYGVTFTSGSGATGTASMLISNIGNVANVFDSCSFIIGTSGASSFMQLGAINTTSTRYVNCDFRFGAGGQGFRASNNCAVNDGSILSGGTSPDDLFDASNPASGANIVLSGFDISNASSSVNLLNTAVGGARVLFRNCKLPASWSGSLNAASTGSDSVFQIHNTDDGDINYAFSFVNEWGTIDHETTLVKSGGASDGTTSISWGMTTNANAEWSHQTLDSPEIVRWNETVGSSVTLTVDILHDSATNLQDDEIWLEVQYLGTSGFPLSVFADDAAATYTTTAADQTTSAATWTTTGLTNPNEQKLSVTFTPQEKGYFIARVKLAKASYTAYVDPVLQVS